MGTKPNFVVLADAQGKAQEFKIQARGSDLWTLVQDYVAGPVKLRIEVIDANALWQPATDQSCKAGGTGRNDVGALVPSAAIGALIGKVGGSTADCPPAVTQGTIPQPSPGSPKVFAVGMYAVIDIKADESGPFFLTMNDILSGFINHTGEMTVKIAVAAS
jgi:hypothetical protein